MPFTHGDPIDLLLPGVAPEGRAVARKVTTFMRLMVRDASSESTTLVVPDPGRATLELKRHVDERSLAAIDRILGRAISTLLGPDSFAWFGEFEGDPGEDWSLFGAMYPKVFPRALPRSGEPLGSLVERVIEVGSTIGMHPDRATLWRARLSWGRRGAHGAMPELRRCMEKFRSTRHPEGVEECLLDLAAAELDRGRPANALRLLKETPPQGRGMRRSRTLQAWATLLSSREEPGRVPRPGEVSLPRPLFELRSDRPDWLPSLPGKAPEVGDEAVGDRWPQSGSKLTHDSVGASAMILFARRGGGFVPVEASCESGLDEALSARLAAVEGCWRVVEHPSHALLLSGLPVVMRANRGVDGGRGKLGLPAASRSVDPEALGLALAPVQDPGGTVVGWVHLEFRHHLIPSRARLEAIGRAMVSRVAETQRPGRLEDSGVSVLESPPTLDPRARPFVDLIARLGIKTAHRRWWGFVIEAGRLVPVAGGGSGLGDPVAGGARGVERSLDALGAFHFSRPEPDLSLHRNAASGWVVPLVYGGEANGVLAMESERKSDFRVEDVRRVATLARETGLALELSCFERRHRARHAEDVHLDPESPGLVSFLRGLEPLRGTHHAIEISGPAGAGKATVAYWLHRARRDGSELRRLNAADLGVEGLRAWASVTPSNVLLTGVEDLEPGAREELDHALVRRARVAASSERRELGRWILTRSRTDPHDPPSSTPIPDPAPNRIHVWLPGLARRRSDIPGVARALVARLADREAMEAPGLSDGVCGLLWRQSWPGNFRDLTRILHGWVLAYPGREIQAADGLEVWSPAVPGPVLRLDPRTATLADLRSALFATRTASGRVNKTRAAAYLGWDPDTLVSRMKAAGLPSAVVRVSGWEPGA